MRCPQVKVFSSFHQESLQIFRIYFRSHHSERLRMDPIYNSFICPLTKKVMKDPVTLENGRTFERVAIEKWFQECRSSGRRPVCPLTSRELRNTELHPSIALRNTIKEWKARNEAAQLDISRKLLSSGTPENDILQTLNCIQQLCLKKQSNKLAIRNAELIPMIVAVLKNSSHPVRFKALETLRIVAEEDSENKEIMAEGDTVRTIIKFLSQAQSKEKEEAVSLLYELSKSERLCEKIGSITGTILLFLGLSSSNSENVLTVEKAEKTLENLEKCEINVRQMAENGRLQPLLTRILEGSQETKLSMAGFLGELILNNDVKVHVARTVGFSLINLMTNTNIQAREAALKALNQISSDSSSSKVLVDAGILPPLVKDLFSKGQNQTRLKEVSATILANIVNSGHEFDSIPVGPNHRTLVSEEIICNLLYLISDTGPAIECKLLQVLVGLTSSSATVSKVVSAIISSGATISLIQFIEAPQKDLRVSSIKLLQNLSQHMGRELSSCLCSTSGLLGSLTRVISEEGGITEEQAAGVGFLANLPERDTGLTRQLIQEGAFEHFIERIKRIRQGEIINRFMAPYFEGLVKVLARITFCLSEESGTARAFCQLHNLASVFIDLLQANGYDNVQMESASALENLSLESKNLTQLPVLQGSGYCLPFFSCLRKPPTINGLCRVHHGLCSIKETFCLLEGNTVEKLVSLLDHENEKVAKSSIAALSTLLEDDVDIEQGVAVLINTEGVSLIFNLLIKRQLESIGRRVVWVVERLLRSEIISSEVANDPNISTALVDAFQHGDDETKQVAELALRHLDRIPNFSGIYLSNS